MRSFWASYLCLSSHEWAVDFWWLGRAMYFKRSGVIHQRGYEQWLVHIVATIVPSHLRTPETKTLGIQWIRTSEDEQGVYFITETKRKVFSFHETILRRWLDPWGHIFFVQKWSCTDLFQNKLLIWFFLGSARNPHRRVCCDGPTFWIIDFPRE